MSDIKLPDGKVIQFKNKINGFNLAEKISKSLAKEACIMSACFESDLLIFSETSKPVIFLSKIKSFPSGNFIFGI